MIVFLIFKRVIGLKSFSKLNPILGWIYTLMVVIVGWVLFNYSISEAWIVLKKMVLFQKGNDHIVLTQKIRIVGS